MAERSGPRYLTKSRFKLAVECPTKLFYTGKPDVYANQKQEDPFLRQLAEGGFQVGELAKVMFPGGIEIRASTHDAQVEATRHLLEKESVTIFEAAIRHGDLFARVDVLRKDGERFELIEVKAKSYDSTEDNPFRAANGGPRREWLPYLLDVAFQRHVMRLSYPALGVKSFLMLADKAAVCSVDGLNQRFRIRRTGGRPTVEVAQGTDSASIGTPLLRCENVDDLIDTIMARPLGVPGDPEALLPDLAQRWGQKYSSDSRIPPVIGGRCAQCEFRRSGVDDRRLSGLEECWGWTYDDLAAGSVLDLWWPAGGRRQELIDRGILRLADIPVQELSAPVPGHPLKNPQRQWLQVTGKRSGRADVFIDNQVMQVAMAKWSFPLHFIDFETTRVAIPFFAGQHPYGNIAFQFSLHVVEEDGTVAHRREYLNTVPSAHANFEFVRQLRAAIAPAGTVFMWSSHENTTLIGILAQLDGPESPPPDAAELRAFLLDLTTLKKDKKVLRAGARAMVDLCALATSAFFHPDTAGSSSIKKLLPAVMRSSDYLRQRYSRPIYGAPGGIPSRNFKDQIWWREKDGVLVDPYEILPAVFEDLPRELLDTLDVDREEALAEGGAAAMAYSRLQFSEVASEERKRIEAALLRYCELDTLAMVMIYEAWREWLRPAGGDSPV